MKKASPSAARSTHAGLPAETAAVTPSNFLAQLTPEEHAALAAIAAPQQHAAGHVIFDVGSAGSTVYFLRDGKVKIKQLSPAGREIILWFCLPGEIFGLAEVARGGGRVVTAQACAVSHVLAVPQARFHSYLEHHPRVARLSMQVLAHRLRLLGEMFVNLVADDVNTRIAKLILRLSSRYGVRVGNEISVTIPLTHQEIADMVGTSRQTVTSTLNELKRKGILSIDNRVIRIDSADLLNELAQHP